VVDIEPLQAGPSTPQPDDRSSPGPRGRDAYRRAGIADDDGTQRVGRRRRFRPEVALLLVAAVFLAGALVKPWPSKAPAASPGAATSASPSPASGRSAGVAGAPTAGIAGPSAIAYIDIPPWDYRGPFSPNEQQVPPSTAPAASAIPTPAWTAVDWSILGTTDPHSGWGFAAAVMPGSGPDAALPDATWVDAGSPPIYAAVPLVQGRDAYAVAVTWPSSVRVTAVTFVYLGPPQSPPYIPPAGFTPNARVTPLPADTVTAQLVGPTSGSAASQPADAGTIRSGQFWIPPSQNSHEVVSSAITKAWRSSPWPWPYGAYQVTITSTTGTRRVILDLLLTA